MITSGLVAVAVASALAVPAGVPAYAAPSQRLMLGSAPTSFAKPRPPKPVTADPTKDGVLVKGKTSVDGRLSSSKKKHPPSGKPRRKPGQPAKTRKTALTKDDTVAATPTRVDFNLNLGICGRRQPDGTFPGPTRCQPTGPVQPQQPVRPGTPPRVVQPRPEDITWDQVLAESKDVIFPKLTVHVQPKDRTLVNMETIVYTDDRGVTTVPVTVAGFSVVVTAVPRSFTWHFGDGTSKTTESPGKPYPSKEITHRYMKRGGVALSVTVNYDASFQVAGLGPQFVGPIPITGPSTPLQVREAVPVLVDPPR